MAIPVYTVLLYSVIIEKYINKYAKTQVHSSVAGVLVVPLHFLLVHFH